jgi:hypothetical protein
MAGKRISVPAEKLDLYRRLLGSTPVVAEKANFGSAYTAVNGNMTSLISKHGVVGIRLPPAEREAFMAQYGTDLFRGDPAWPPAREFVAVPDALLEDTDALRPYLELAHRHALTLKPKTKATKKR